MKNKLTAACAAALSSSVLFAAAAHAQSTPASAPAAKPAVEAKAASSVAKQPVHHEPVRHEPVHHAESAKSASAAHHEVKRRPILRKKKIVPVATKLEPIPDGAEKWGCEEDQALYIKGNMKRDQILTMYYEGKAYQLPRVQTTTGADRFYDPASGMDLVVIPTKAMLFSDKDDDRLADECMTDAMIHNNELAPTQSNAISKKQ